MSVDGDVGFDSDEAELYRIHIERARANLDALFGSIGEAVERHAGAGGTGHSGRAYNAVFDSMWSSLAEAGQVIGQGLGSVSSGVSQMIEIYGAAEDRSTLPE